MGLLLFILSIILGAVMLPLGLAYGLYTAFYQRQWRNGLRLANKKLYSLAAAYDKYGSVACAELFNRVLIKKSSVHKFGDIKDTISAVLGYNLLKGTLTPTGIFLVDLLDWIDPGHVTNAIEE